MIRKPALRPGDILFLGPKQKWLIGSWFLTWAQNVVGKSPIHNRSYSHVAIVDWDVDYVVESRWPKSRRRKLEMKKWCKQYEMELWRVRRVNPQQIKDTLDWAYKHLGEWYDLGLFMWGMFDIKHAEVCSTFVAKAFKAAGIDFKIHKKIGAAKNFHSPDEIAANTDLIKKITESRIEENG